MSGRCRLSPALSHAADDVIAGLPAYRVLDECADERDRLNRFRVGLFIRDDLVAEATAGSIAEARRLAALLTMKRVGERPDTLLLPDQIRSD